MSADRAANHAEAACSVAKRINQPLGFFLIAQGVALFLLASIEQNPLGFGLIAAPKGNTMSREKVNPDYFKRLSAAMRETRKRVSLYNDQERARLDQLARSMMGQAVAVTCGPR